MAMVPPVTCGVGVHRCRGRTNVSCFLRYDNAATSRRLNNARRTCLRAMVTLCHCDVVLVLGGMWGPATGRVPVLHCIALPAVLPSPMLSPLRLERCC